jgi:excisionase family DNA binding protein
MNTGSRKTVFTTGEVARVLGVNINTVIKWFEEGKLSGFRLPGSNDRRIPTSSLRNFMRQNGMPLDLLNEDSPMRRQHERVALNAGVQMKISDGPNLTSVMGQLVDLSHGGARMSLSYSSGLSAIPLDSRELKLRIVEGDLQNVELDGQVVYLQATTGGWSMGCRFNKETRQDRLERFLSGQPTTT